MSTGISLNIACFSFFYQWNSWFTGLFFFFVFCKAIFLSRTIFTLTLASNIDSFARYKNTRWKGICCYFSRLCFEFFYFYLFQDFTRIFFPIFLSNALFLCFKSNRWETIRYLEFFCLLYSRSVYLWLRYILQIIIFNRLVVIHLFHPDSMFSEWLDNF